jgi:hypothetical protein
MNLQEKKEADRLCELIQIETNPYRFTKLVEQLNQVLEKKEKRLNA